MAAVVEKRSKRWTYEEYYRLNDDQRYEIIDGELLMAPAQDTWHQSWTLELVAILREHVGKLKLGRVFVAPVDVVLDSENTVQPDIIFVATANVGIIQRRAIFGVPDLLMEIVSPSSVRRDRYDKRQLYARFGVKEYWVGDPANRTLEILTLKGGAYELHSFAENKGLLTSLLLPDLAFDLSQILVPDRDTI
jgi:Uma2 family endonuclease